MQTMNVQTTRPTRAPQATPPTMMIESAYFSVVGTGVVVDPLITLVLAPGTRGERTAVGIVTDLAQPTPFLAPGVKRESYSVGHQSVDVVLTVSVDGDGRVAHAQTAKVVSSVSRHDPLGDAMDVRRHAISEPDADLCFPNVEPVETHETMRERIWATVSARLELSTELETGGLPTR
jgi:hypothetical protein